MKLKYFISALVVAGLACGAYAAKDPVLMKINNKDVKVSEFEYLYKKNLEQQVNKESIDEYVERFVNYKLKVAEAERLGYDTLPRIKAELEGYKNDMLSPYLTDTELKERLVNEAYDRMTKNVNVSHLMLARGRDDAENAKQIAKMDSIRTCILNGENFNDLVMKYSVDRSKVNNKGEYGFITSGVFPYAFEYAAFNTPVGSISQPIVTDYGIHLIKVNGVRPDEGQVEVGHILLLFPRENVTDSAKLAVKTRIDSIYNCLKAGEEFEALAKKYSQDPGSARNDGKLPFFGRGRMVKPFEDASFALKDGEISEPIETRYGYHIIKKYSHKPVPTLEEARPTIDLMMKADERSTMPADSKMKQIMSQLNYKANDKLGDYLKSELAKHGSYDSTFVTDVVAKSDYPICTFDTNQKLPLSLMAKMLNTKAKFASNDVAVASLVGNVDKIARKEISRYYADNLIELNSDYRNLMNEYREGTLLFEVMNHEVWNKAKNDEAYMQKLFKEAEDEYTEALEAYDDDLREEGETVTVATGLLAAPFIRRLADRCEARFPAKKINVIPIKNRFFGEQITVAGLITGGDLIEQLRDKELGERLLIPDTMLRSGEDVFLDDVRLSEVEDTLHVPVNIVESSGGSLLDAFLGYRREKKERFPGYEPEEIYYE